MLGVRESWRQVAGGDTAELDKAVAYVERAHELLAKIAVFEQMSEARSEEKAVSGGARGHAAGGAGHLRLQDTPPIASSTHTSASWQDEQEQERTMHEYARGRGGVADDLSEYQNFFVAVNSLEAGEDDCPPTNQATTKHHFSPSTGEAHTDTSQLSPPNKMTPEFIESCFRPSSLASFLDRVEESEPGASGGRNHHSRIYSDTAQSAYSSSKASSNSTNLASLQDSGREVLPRPEDECAPTKPEAKKPAPAAAPVQAAPAQSPASTAAASNLGRPANHEHEARIHGAPPPPLDPAFVEECFRAALEEADAAPPGRSMPRAGHPSREDGPGLGHDTLVQRGRGPSWSVRDGAGGDRTGGDGAAHGRTGGDGAAHDRTGGDGAARSDPGQAAKEDTRQAGGGHGTRGGATQDREERPQQDRRGHSEQDKPEQQPGGATADTGFFGGKEEGKRREQDGGAAVAARRASGCEVAPAPAADARRACVGAEALAPKLLEAAPRLIWNSALSPR